MIIAVSIAAVFGIGRWSNKWWQGRGAAWKITTASKGIYRVEWLGKRTAFHATYWTDRYEADGSGPLQSLHRGVSGDEDTRPGGDFPLVDVREEDILSFQWIDGTRKTASARMKTGVETFLIVPNSQ